MVNNSLIPVCGDQIWTVNGKRCSAFQRSTSPVELIVWVQVGRDEDPVVDRLSVEVGFSLEDLVRHGAHRQPGGGSRVVLALHQAGG